MGIALLFEAIPHKITDYLLLLNTGCYIWKATLIFIFNIGMTRKQAALANFGTALFIFAGVGISGGLFYGVRTTNRK